MQYPRTRRSFENNLDEFLYLKSKIRFWYIDKNRPSQAKKFIKRFNYKLKQLFPKPGSIIRAESKALVFEVQGQWKKAAKCREEQWEALKKLQRLFPGLPKSVQKYVKLEYGKKYYAACIWHMAYDYQCTKDTKKAKLIFRRYKAYCKQKRVKPRPLNFDSKE